MIDNTLNGHQLKKNFFCLFAENLWMNAEGFENLSVLRELMFIYYQKRRENTQKWQF